MHEPLPSNLADFVRRYGGYIVLCLGPVFISFLAYVLVLGSSNFSSSPDDWGSFADFLMPGITLALGVGNLLVLYMLARIAHDIEAKTLERQLSFELYKDFITKLDAYVIEYFSNRGRPNSEVYLALIQHLADSAVQNFSGFMSEEEEIAFKAACAKLSDETWDYYENNDASHMGAFTSSVTEIKTLIFQQVRNPKNALIKQRK